MRARKSISPATLFVNQEVITNSTVRHTYQAKDNYGCGLSGPHYPPFQTFPLEQISFVRACYNEYSVVYER